MGNSAKLRNYTGESVTVTYDLKRCIHAAECVGGLPEVFDPEKRPWIQPDNAPAEQVVDVVRRCPTGALKVEWDGEAEVAPSKNVIVPLSNGPLYVDGDVTIMVDDESLPETRVALCRCGASKNKPFCDNSHRDIDFEADGQVSDNRADHASTEDGGLLAITPSANGPCLLRGNFEIRADDGSTVFRSGKAALCRCGASDNKPFCDGMHNKVGFSGD